MVNIDFKIFLGNIKYCFENNKYCLNRYGLGLTMYYISHTIMVQIISQQLEKVISFPEIGWEIKCYEIFMDPF